MLQQLPLLDSFFLEKHTDLCEEKYKTVCMMLSYWTVKEILTKSIFNFRESYLQTSPFLENHAEYFFLRRIKGLLCFNIFSVSVLGSWGGDPQVETWHKEIKWLTTKTCPFRFFREEYLFQPASPLV